jgi:Carboxypeptidase regulatory-like domain
MRATWIGVALAGLAAIVFSLACFQELAKRRQAQPRVRASTRMVTYGSPQAGGSQEFRIGGATAVTVVGKGNREGFGTVKGRVVRADNGKAVGGATVSIAGSGRRPAAKTDTRGYYTLRSVPVGKVTVFATADNQLLVTGGLPEMDLPDRAVARIEAIRLQPGGRISGSLPGEARQLDGSSSATVRCELKRVPNTYVAAVLFADPNGAFRTRALRPGRYVVTVVVSSPPAGSPSARREKAVATTEVTVRAGMETKDVVPRAAAD